MTHLFFYFFFFFFSSRRRHTRLQGDWSSDVCSSDLTVTALLVDLARSLARHGLSLLAVANAHWDPAHLRAIEAAVAEIRRADGARIVRSEEHTSELQSPCNLVCRLLLEKKKKQ